MSTPQERAALLRIMAESGQHSKWATDFLESPATEESVYYVDVPRDEMAVQLEAGHQLSAKQEDKLYEIQTKG